MPTGWYVARADKQGGPFSVEQLRAFASSGQILPTDHIWREGMVAGVLAAKVKDLLPGLAPPASADGPSGADRPPSAEPPEVEDPSRLGLPPGAAEARLLPVADSAGAAGDEVGPAVPAAGRRPPDATASKAPPEQPRKRLAFGQKGVVILSQDGVHVQYRKTCVQCGYQDTCRSTMLIGQGVTRVHFFCRQCRKTRDVEIRGAMQ